MSKKSVNTLNTNTRSHTHLHTLDSPNNFGRGNIANTTTDHLVKIINLAQLLVHKMLYGEQFH